MSASVNISGSIPAASGGSFTLSWSGLDKWKYFSKFAGNMKAVGYYTIKFAVRLALSGSTIAPVFVTPGHVDYIIVDNPSGSLEVDISAADIASIDKQAGGQEWCFVAGNDYYSNVIADDSSSRYYAEDYGSSGGWIYTLDSCAGSATISRYSVCTPPRSVFLDQSSVAPSQPVALNWREAGAGTNNAISKYEVWRATSANGSYSLLTSTTSTSCSVSAPSQNGATYYFKIKTIGSVSGYDSELSEAYASLTCSFSAPSAPQNISVSTQYAKSGQTVALSWRAASAGTNNPVSGYAIYRDGVAYKTDISSGVTSVNVPVHSSAGGSYAYSVVTIGQYSNSAQSESVTVYTYSDPQAPKTIAVSDKNPDAGDTLTLSWSDASNGSYNQITGYRVYVSKNQDSGYQTLLETTSQSANITAPSGMGETAYYKVESIGARSSSGLSGTYASLTTKVYTPPPASVTLSAELSNGESCTLSWSVAQGGTTNPIVGYGIERRSKPSITGSWSVWSSLSTSVDEAISVSPPDQYGAYFQFRVRALSGISEQYHSAWCESGTLRRNHAPFSAFTDATLIRHETHVKAVHMTELQKRVAVLCEFYGMATPSFQTVISGETSLGGWLAHIREIRNAIDALPVQHDAWIAIDKNCPRADVVTQIREIILEL